MGLPTGKPSSRVYGYRYVEYNIHHRAMSFTRYKTRLNSSVTVTPAIYGQYRLATKGKGGRKNEVVVNRSVYLDLGPARFAVRSSDRILITQKQHPLL